MVLEEFTEAVQESLLLYNVVSSQQHGVSLMCGFHSAG